MPAKSIISDQAAQKALLEGISMVSNAVGRTLGPKGRNVALEKKWGAPVITNDGVTIAKEVELPESFENMGAQLIKEAASKTNDVAGDGTTTATVLAHNIVREGMKNVAAGADPDGHQARAGQVRGRLWSRNWPESRHVGAGP